MICKIISNEMDHSGNPSKKMRLDEFADEWNDDPFENNFAENDDLWGEVEDDEVQITAEEVAIWELQATQKLQSTAVDVQRTNSSTSVQHTSNNLNPAAKEEEWKQERYALEGKLKLLENLHKEAISDLNKERVNKEQMIKQKTEEFQKREQVLKAEIEKLKTSEHFKDQEMKHTHDKVVSLEKKLEVFMKNGVTTSPEQSDSNTRSSKKFLNRFHFEKSEKKTTESAVQTVNHLAQGKKYSLPLISSRGERNGQEILSSLLFNRNQNSSSTANYSNLQLSQTFQLADDLNDMTTALAQLNANQDTEGLWECYDKLLKQHITFLQSDIFNNRKCDLTSTSKIPGMENTGHSFFYDSQHSLQSVELESRHLVFTQCLKDLIQLFLWRTPQLCSGQNGDATEHLEQMLKRKFEQDIPLCSAPLFTVEKKMETVVQAPLCLLSLSTLAKIGTYPENYSYKKEELRLALSALVSWSSHSPSSMEPYIYDLPVQSVASSECDISTSSLTLQFLTNLIGLKSFRLLVHQEDCCVFASIAGLCHITNNSMNDDFSAALNLVESFLCSCVSILGTSALQDENCQCSSQIVQGFILMLWHHYQVCSKGLSSLGIRVLRKGILTMYMLFTHVKNFREKRAPVEDCYVLLIYNLARLTRENPSLRSLNDTIHELWDFQEEGSEFDNDELSFKESQLCASSKAMKS